MSGKRTAGQNLAITAAAGIVGLAAARDSPAATVAAAGVATLAADRMGVFGNNLKRMSAEELMRREAIERASYQQQQQQLPQSGSEDEVVSMDIDYSTQEHKKTKV